MTEFSRRTQLLCWVAYLIALPASWSWLPEMVGEGSKQLARGAYVATMLATALPMPWMMAGGLLKWLRQHPSLLNLPQKDYWLAPERTHTTWRRLDGLLLRLGWWIWCLLALIHYRAVTERPDGLGDQTILPSLPETAFEIVMFVLVIAILADVLSSTLTWRVPKAQLEVFRARQMRDSSDADGKRSIRRLPRSGQSARRSGHGEPR